jgi:hypothetical protein
MIDNGSLRYYLTQPDLQRIKLHISSFQVKF